MTSKSVIQLSFNTLLNAAGPMLFSLLFLLISLYSFKVLLAPVMRYELYEKETWWRWYKARYYDLWNAKIITLFQTLQVHEYTGPERNCGYCQQNMYSAANMKADCHPLLGCITTTGNMPTIIIRWWKFFLLETVFRNSFYDTGLCLPKQGRGYLN